LLAKWDGNIRREAAVECNGGMKKHDFRPVYCFMSEMMQGKAIVTIEGKLETAPKLSDGTTLNDLE